MRRLTHSLEPLRERPFRLLWLGRSLSNVGDALVPVALTFAVLDLGDASDLGIVFTAYMGSRMLFIVAGGVWADRLPRQLVMIVADAVRAIVQGLIALAFFTDTIEVWQLAAASAVSGVCSAFFGPASTGLIPELVRGGLLQQANALLSLSGNAIEVFGPAISGVLVATLGYGVVFAVDAASFLASLLCLAALRLPRRVAEGPRKSFLADAHDGLREVLARSWLVTTLCCDAATNVAIAVYFVLGPVVVEDHFGGASEWGLMMAAGAAGGLLGGVVALRYHPARPLFAAYVFILALPIQLAALAPPLPLPLLMLGSGLVFLSIVVGNAFWQTMEMQHVPNEALSRVDSISWMVSLVAMPIGYLLAGPLSEAFGVEATLLAAAALAVASLTAALSLRSVRELRRVDERGQTPAGSVPEPS
jgi:MFS family permease